MVLFLIFKMLSLYCKNTQGKLELHSKIIGETQGILLYVLVHLRYVVGLEAEWEAHNGDSHAGRVVLHPGN